MKVVTELRISCSTAEACDSLGVPRPTYYRNLSPPTAKIEPAKPHPSSLGHTERTAVVGELTSDRFADLAVPQVYATLLDEGRFFVP